MDNQEIFDTFRLNLKHYREVKKWNQMDLSIQANVSTGTIGSIEAGTSKPSFDMIVKLAFALEVHPADLFLRDTSRSKTETFNLIEDKLFFKLHEIIHEMKGI